MYPPPPPPIVDLRTALCTNSKAATREAGMTNAISALPLTIKNAKPSLVLYVAFYVSGVDLFCALRVFPRVLRFSSQKGNVCTSGPRVNWGIFIYSRSYILEFL